MSLFGFEYNSFGSIILYFTVVIVVGFPTEMFVQAFTKVLKSQGVIDTKIEIALFIILDTLSTALVMSLVDYYMSSVSASDTAVFVLALVMAILSVDKDEKEGE